MIPIVTPFPQRPRGLGFLGRQAGKEEGMEPSPLSHTSMGEQMKICERMRSSIRHLRFTDTHQGPLTRQ